MYDKYAVAVERLSCLDEEVDYRKWRNSKLDQNQRTSMTNKQSQLKDVMMWLDIFLKEGLYVPPKPFCILYVRAMKTAAGLK